MKANKTYALFVGLFLLMTPYTYSQTRFMHVHLNDGTIQDFQSNLIDSVSFSEQSIDEGTLEAGRELMSPQMLSSATCTNYYTHVNHYLISQNKDIREFEFGSTVTGQYALMPLDKSVMIKLYGGGKYVATKYNCYNVEAIYDENLNPVCAYTIERGNATYEKNINRFIIDLTGKEGVYYLRRFVRIAYADKSSVKVVDDFSPKQKTANIEQFNTPLSRHRDSIGNYLFTFAKRFLRLSFDFTIDDDVNKDMESLQIADFHLLGNNIGVDILRRAPEPLKVRYYGDNTSITKADAQELAFKSGFAIGTDTIIRSLDFYKPLCGKSQFILWLKGEEYNTEPTTDVLQAHANALAPYKDYYISCENSTIMLWNNSTCLATIPIMPGQTIRDLGEQIKSNPSFSDFMFTPLVDENVYLDNLVSFPKIHLVGSYYQSYDVTYNGQITSFDYHYDSFPVVFRSAIDKSVHTFEAVCDTNGFFVGIDGNFKLVGYELLDSLSISPNNITISNIDYLDGTTGYFKSKFTGVSRLSEWNVLTQRSPYLLGLMGHVVKANSAEGSVDYPASDVSSERLNNICGILETEGYTSLNMDNLITYMDNGMNTGLYCFFMFDDFRFNEIYTTVSTRNIFLNHSIKTNLAVINRYLWESESDYYKCHRSDIAPMKQLGWSCVSHSLRHNQPIAKKPSIYVNWELKEIRKECLQYGMNSEVFVYNWDGTWEPTDMLLYKNGFKYAINSRGTYTVKATNPYRMGRSSFQEAMPFSTVNKILTW